MLSERTIINALILAAGLIVGPYLTLQTFHGNFWPLLVFSGVTFLLVVFFFVGDRICALPILGLSFPGDLNYLPLGLTAGELCIFATILYYLVTYVAIKQKPLKTGPPGFLYPIMIIGLIILYHQRSFGIHAFGGGTEGSRPAVLMLVIVTCYMCGINIVHPPLIFLQRLPLYCLALTIIASTPYFIATGGRAFDSLTDTSTLSQSVSDLNGGGVGRDATMANLGSAIEMILLAYFPIYTWWRPERWWVVFLSVACFWMTAHGGYRNALALFCLSFMLGAWCYVSWRALILVPPCLIGALALTLAQPETLDSLPMTVQRSLSFIPAKWDKNVQDSADSSNEFRRSLQQVYLQEYATKGVLLGKGFAINIAEWQKTTDNAIQHPSDGYYQSKAFIESKIFHIGWISVYDAVGLVGTAAFIMLGLNISYRSGRYIFSRGRERRSPLLPLRIWIFCNVTRDLIGFFTLFGDFSQTFTGFCAYAIILAHLSNIERTPEKSAAHSSEHELFGLPKPGKFLPVEPLGETSR